MSSLRTWWAGLCALCVLAGSAAGDEKADFVKGALERAITGSRQPMADVTALVDDRLPHMPAAASASEWDAIAGRLRKDVFDKVIFRGPARDWHRAAPDRVAGDDFGRSRLSYQKTSLRGRARTVDSGLVV